MNNNLPRSMYNNRHLILEYVNATYSAVCLHVVSLFVIVILVKRLVIMTGDPLNSSDISPAISLSDYKPDNEDDYVSDSVNLETRDRESETEHPVNIVQVLKWIRVYQVA